MRSATRAAGGLGRDALHSQLTAAIQVVLHMRRLRSGGRVLDVVGVFDRAAAGRAGAAVVRPVWIRGDGWAEGHPVLDEPLRERGGSTP